MQSISSVISPTSDELEHACTCAGDFLTELAHAGSVVLDIAPNARTMLDVVNALRPPRAAFPRDLKLFQLALTLPVYCVVRTFVIVYQKSQDVHSDIYGGGKRM